MVRKNDRFVVGLDIGTTKICCVIAEKKEDGGLDVVGIGRSASRGLRKGVVVNVDQTVDALKAAVEEAELMAGVSVERAFVGVAGGHIKGFNSRGVISIAGREREVTRDDVDRVIESARAVQLPTDRIIFHAVPQDFILDEQDGIRDPVGMNGSRLEANVHIVTGAIPSLSNITNCVNRAGIEVVEMVLEQLAAAETALTHDEKELGVALVDIGGGTTDLAIFEHGAICHTAVLPTGGDHFTNDIAVGLRTPVPEAERIKVKYGCALASLVDDHQTIEVPSVGGRKPRVLSRHILCEILQPRTEEIFNLLQEEIARAGYEESLTSGLVVTGGGAILEGVPEIAEQIFDLPVRRGSPTGIGGLVDGVSTPVFSTAVGLAMYGADAPAQTQRLTVPTFLLGKVGVKMKSWFSELF
ncbi:MAG TPA: cell division protein FtsA [Candidatus Polarisedimenticolia bacterium]|nr:cell division protein FtsA [Candidatus Polarisedimenticolia bacterium]